MTFATGSKTEPSALYGEAYYRGDTVPVVTKSLRNPRIAAGETTGVLLVAGQSLFGNSVNAAYSPANSSKIDNLNILDGGVYGATDPLLGVDGGLAGNMALRIADKLITAGKYQRVILAMIAIGGTSVAEWAPGGGMFQRFPVGFQRCAEQGLSVSGVLWQQGERDHNLGTSQAAYTASLSALIAGVRALGFNQKWLLARSTVVNNIASPDIRAGLVACQNGTDILAGADTDILTGASNRHDGTHLTATGADAGSTLWRDAIIAGL